MDKLIINKPVALVLQPQEIVLVLDALAELPFKTVQPTFDRIVEQIRSSHEAAPPAS